MRSIGIIPARWASSRFPGKALAPIAGKPLIIRVLERAREARRLAAVLVATDDERIAAAVAAVGAKAVMTRPDHPSGTDRIAEAAAADPADIVVNIQGDEPLVEPGLIDELVVALEAGGWEMTTAAAPLTEPRELQSPNVVKVVCDAGGRALYFSRSPIPLLRDGDGRGMPSRLHWRHMGLYAYDRGFLERMVKQPPCAIEQAEQLEQLRALYMGARIKVIPAERDGVGVDVPEDVARAEAALRAAGLD